MACGEGKVMAPDPAPSRVTVSRHAQGVEKASPGCHTNARIAEIFDA